MMLCSNCRSPWDDQKRQQGRTCHVCGYDGILEVEEVSDLAELPEANMTAALRDRAADLENERRSKTSS
jgi:hypothetical protein